MKSMIVTLLLSLIFCSVAEAQKKSHRELEGLKGPVRKITEEIVSLSEEQGKWIEAEKGSDYQFDAKGNWIKMTALSSDINNNDPAEIEKFIIKRKITYY